MRVATAQTPLAVAARYLDEGKDAYLGKLIGFFEKTILRSDLCVAVTKVRLTLGRCCKRHGSNEMQLQIRKSPIVHLKVRRGARPAVFIVLQLRGDVELPMLIFDRFRIIGPKWGPGICAARNQRYTPQHYRARTAYKFSLFVKSCG